MRRVSRTLGIVILLAGGALLLIGAANGVNSVQYQMMGKFPDAAVGQMATGFVIAAVGAGLTWWGTKPPTAMRMPD